MGLFYLETSWIIGWKGKESICLSITITKETSLMICNMGTGFHKITQGFGMKDSGKKTRNMDWVGWWTKMVGLWWRVSGLREIKCE